jgi:uncharacterized membrane protein YidH (DUF202 family)
MLKIQKLAILFILIGSLIPVYAIIKYLQNIIQPRQSFGRLLLYVCSALAVVFIFTFGVVFLIGKLFRPAS